MRNEQELINEYRIKFNDFFKYTNDFSDLNIKFEKLKDEIKYYKLELRKYDTENYYLLKTILNYYIGTLYSECSFLTKKYDENKRINAKIEKNIYEYEDRKIIKIDEQDYKRFNDREIKYVFKSNDYYKSSKTILDKHYIETEEWNTIKTHLYINMHINYVKLCPILVIVKLDNKFDSTLDLYNDMHTTLAYKHAVEEFCLFQNNGMDDKYIKLIDNNVNLRFENTIKKMVNIYKQEENNEIKNLIKTLYDTDFIVSFGNITKDKTEIEKIKNFDKLLDYFNDNKSTMNSYNNIYLEDTLTPIHKYISSWNCKIDIGIKEVIKEFLFLKDEFDYSNFYENEYNKDYLLSSLFNIFDKTAYSLFNYIIKEGDISNLDEKNYDFNNLISKGIPLLEKISEPNFRMLIKYLNIITFFNEQKFIQSLEKIRERRISITHKPIYIKNNNMKKIQNNQINELIIYLSIFILLTVTSININEDNNNN